MFEVELDEDDDLLYVHGASGKCNACTHFRHYIPPTAETYGPRSLFKIYIFETLRQKILFVDYVIPPLAKPIQIYIYIYIYIYIHLSVSTGPGTSAVVTTGGSVVTSRPGPSAFLFSDGMTIGDLDVNCLGAPENKIQIILQFVVLYLCKQNNT